MFATVHTRIIQYIARPRIRSHAPEPYTVIIRGTKLKRHYRPEEIVLFVQTHTHTQLISAHVRRVYDNKRALPRP